MITVLIVWAASILGMGLTIKKAPEGWQDEKGFHLGKRP
jgi:hypothetical protein